jgi:hypothetical protein
MSLVSTTAASIHQLGAAAALRRRGLLPTLVMSAGWLVEQHTLRTTKRLDTQTNRAVALKDCMVASALAAGLIATLARRTRGALGTTARRDRLARWATRLNRAFALGAIACTPLVNFRLLGAYRPGIFYRLFT